jgi:hypothetical protein
VHELALPAFMDIVEGEMVTTVSQGERMEWERDVVFTSVPAGY